MVKSEFEKAIEQKTGLTIEEIRDMAPEDLRRLREEQFGEPMQIVVGNSIRTLSREEVEKEVDEAIGRLEG